MIMWINGTFGVGKTTTSDFIVEHSEGWRVFDPEWVGYMLFANLKDLGADDFQDLPPWRSLVPQVMAEVEALTGSSLVAPQTVLVEEYWDELSEEMAARGLDVFHVVLDCDDAVLRRRIEADAIETDALQWRIDHLARAADAAEWMHRKADLVIDTTALGAGEAASAILSACAESTRR